MSQKSLAMELQQVITERTEYSTVDSAYEAVDSMDSSSEAESMSRWWEIVNTSYDGKYLYSPIFCNHSRFLYRFLHVLLFTLQKNWMS